MAEETKKPRGRGKGITKVDRRTADRINTDRQSIINGDLDGIIKAYNTFCGSQERCLLCPYREIEEKCNFAWLIDQLQYHGVLPQPEHRYKIKKAPRP